MDREILFRGKRVDNGAWAVGFVVMMPNTSTTKILAWCESCIIDGEGRQHFIVYEVDPSTVGQYTGLTDKNDKRAFEGDVIVPGGYGPEDVTGIIRFGGNRPDTSGWGRGEIGFWVEWKGDYSQILRNDLGYWLPKSLIIGNIYDGLDTPQICATCEYLKPDGMGNSVCTNAKSDSCANMADDDNTCDCWEARTYDEQN